MPPLGGNVVSTVLKVGNPNDIEFGSVDVVCSRDEVCLPMQGLPRRQNKLPVTDELANQGRAYSLFWTTFFREQLAAAEPTWKSTRSCLVAEPQLTN